MLKRNTLSLIVAFSLGLLTTAVSAEEVGKSEKTEPASINQIAENTPVVDIKAESYAMGFNLGDGMRQDLIETYGIELDKESIIKGFTEGLSNKQQYTEDELNALYQSLNSRINQQIEEVIQAKALENKKQGDEYRAEYAKKEGVVKTDTGMLYRIIEKGNDVHPNKESIISVNYTAKFVDGTVFDKTPSSIQIPIILFPAGVQDGISLIGEGGRIELVLAPELAYGEQPLKGIPGNSTVIFEIDLLSVTQAELVDNKE